MQALVINRWNQILYTVDVEESVRTVEIAGAVTINGAPVNRGTYRVTRSKANFERAKYMHVDPLKRCEHNGFTFFTTYNDEPDWF